MAYLAEPGPADIEVFVGLEPSFASGAPAGSDERFPIREILRKC